MKIFSNHDLGPLKLKNRIAMAPMTRCRAIEGNVPGPLTAEYYAQRASAGLIISESIEVSPQGAGYVRATGLYTEAQVIGWKAVTKAVHDKGGIIFAQLFHAGRISHPDFQNGQLPVAPSEVPAEGEVFTINGPQKIVMPRALKLEELPEIVLQYKRAAENAKTAGFDGVEIHGGFGYLLDQFLRDGSNKRTDSYGGSIQNRARLALEVTSAVIEVFGADRVGFRITPTDTHHTMYDSQPLETFSYLVSELNKLNVGIIHIMEPIAGPLAASDPTARLGRTLRKFYKGTMIVNGGYELETAEKEIKDGFADAVAFGAKFLANPDLPERFQRGEKLNLPDRATFYQGEEKGYTDYPSLKN